MVTIKTLLIAVLLHSVCAHAGDYPGRTMATFCTVQGFGKGSLIETALPFFKLDDGRDYDTIRRQMAERTTKDFVEPVFTRGCATKNLDGWQFVKDVQSACESGCETALEDWPALRGQVRASQLTLCRADCRAGVSTLMGLAVGYDTGRTDEYKKHAR